MGVYIIKSKHCNWYKIGHHKITSRRPTIFHRYIRRGFYSCICPQEIENKVGFQDIELLYWFPNLDVCHERSIQVELKKTYESCGEWFKDLKIDQIASMITIKHKGILE